MGGVRRGGGGRWGWGLSHAVNPTGPHRHITRERIYGTGGIIHLEKAIFIKLAI
jgi:hypothetical protein